MKALKYKILFVILFMTIGIAAVTTNLITNGSTNIAKNPDDFNVYFSEYFDSGDNNDKYVDVVISVFSEKEISFTGNFQNIGDESNILIEVTNGSKNYDAEVSFNCSTESPYLQVYNNIEDDVITATNYSVAIIQVTLIKSYVGASNIEEEITCTLDASAVERTSQGSGSVNAPVNPFYIGREVAIGAEKFNVISNDSNSVTMLAKYNLGTDYRQSDVLNTIAFADEVTWPIESTVASYDFDVMLSTGPVYEYLIEYISYLKAVIGDESITGSIMTMDEASSLFDKNYSWYFNGQPFWLRTSTGSAGNIYYVGEDGKVQSLGAIQADFLRGIRPTITISKDIAEQLLNVYPVGKEISIGDEKFNVISDNGTTVSMLAQYNISSNTYNQTTVQMRTSFSNRVGWEYTPGPKDIDVQTWGGDAKTTLNNYVSYLNTEYGVDVTGNLITVLELGDLGCTISDNYSYGSDVLSCKDSEYSDWLVNGQYWWTRSAYSIYSSDIFVMANSGNLSNYIYDEIAGVRPLITVSKEYLN